MKIDKIEIGATIPVVQYGNIMPSISISDTTLEEGSDVALKYIKDLFAKYSEKGAITEKDVITQKFLKTSFNEKIDIEYDPVAHTYHKDGVKLTGATEYTKKFYKDFDVETISKVLEKTWGVPSGDIKELWASNGDITSGFGAVVHKAIEEYVKLRETGAIISEKKGETVNYALPKHPILKSIVEGFIAIDKVKAEITVPEALLTDIENKVCGHTDRISIIDSTKKICRVGDYKVNINSEEVDKNLKVISDDEALKSLPATKLTKYQIQMSIYANMLQKCGWTVEGLDVYVYESEWKHFELPVLKII
jgi:hypothetical protein